MSGIPIDKQFSRMALNSGQHPGLYEGSKAQPQAPAVPKSFVVPSFPEPSFSTLLKNQQSPVNSSSHYENIQAYSAGHQPIYSNLPPPPPPPVPSLDNDLPLPPPPADLSAYYDDDDQDDDDDLAPPSPVESTRSSSYSELRRADDCDETTSNYAPLSQVCT